MRNPLLLMWPAWRFLVSLFQYRVSSAFCRQILRWTGNLMCVRFVLYREYLKKAAGKYDHVMLTDIRDVYFQADPFSWHYEDGVSAFLEAEDLLIDQCPLNRQWILDVFDEKLLSQIGRKIVSCAGVVVGDYATMDRYLERMLHYLLKARTMHLVGGADQGIHNFICYQEQSIPTRIYPNFHGAVLTMGCIADDSVSVPCDGLLRNVDGSIIPILHQYDRCKKFVPRTVSS